jgi:hypothetical protein
MKSFNISLTFDLKMSFIIIIIYIQYNKNVYKDVLYDDEDKNLNTMHNIIYNCLSIFVFGFA